MLPTTNATISILRLTGTTKRVWTSVATGIEVYINQISEELVKGIDAQGSFTPYRMMTDGTHTALEIGDRVSDGTLTYDVRGKTAYDSIAGVSHQYILTVPFL